MTGADPPILPSGRALAQWERSLAARQPQRLLWFDLLVHHVEALAETDTSTPLDPLRQALLHHLCTDPAHDPTSLRLDPALLHRELEELTREGLVQPGGRPTLAGRQAAAAGVARLRRRERRAFHFLDNGDPNHPPHFLPLPGRSFQPAAPPTDWRFDPATLRDCVAQTEAWKRQHGFPEEVAAIAGAGGDWRGVMVDFAQRLALVLVVTAEGVLGFLPRADGSPESAEPALAWPPGGAEVFPELRQESSAEDWRAAWQRWAEARNLPPAEVEVCTVQRDRLRVVVQAPRRLLERLRSGSRAEALREEGWLLAAVGRGWEAARIELEEVPV
jgi:hypothetical protein